MVKSDTICNALVLGRWAIAVGRQAMSWLNLVEPGFPLRGDNPSTDQSFYNEEEV